MRLFPVAAFLVDFTAAGFALPACLLIYRTPESVGLRPDGDPADSGSDGSGGDSDRGEEEGEEERETESLLGREAGPDKGSTTAAGVSGGGEVVHGNGALR